MLRFLIDKEILHAKEAFSAHGEVNLMAGSEMTRESLLEKDVLVVRTTTKVNRELLEGSKVKFVATATSGVDHIDLQYLKENGIGFSSSAGCNATAVAEYVINALFMLEEIKELRVQNRILGIIGAGNVGSALQKRAESLGIRCLLNDPPLEEKDSSGNYVSLEEILKNASIISLHVPLIKAGKYKTSALLNQDNLKLVQNNSILINTCRGGVIDEIALKRHIGKFDGLILDVWEGEPNIDFDTVSKADIATPHIAGYSLEGKINATLFAYNSICRFFNFEPKWDGSKYVKKPVIRTATQSLNPILDVLKQVYNIFHDDQALRNSKMAKNPANVFRSLRNSYNFRSEFASCTLEKPSIWTESQKSKLASLGFRF